MKTIEELKKEQYDLKAKLHEVIELINGEEFQNLSRNEKELIGQQRVGMELYLGCLIKRIYGGLTAPETSNLLVMAMLWSTFDPHLSTPSLEASEDLQKMLDEEKAKLKETKAKSTKKSSKITYIMPEP